MNHSFKEKCAILLIVSAILAVSLTQGCLVDDKDFFIPGYTAHFDFLDVRSIGDALTESNISWDWDNDARTSIWFILGKNETFVFSENNTNATIAITATIQDKRPDDNRTTAVITPFFETYEEYRFPTQEEAVDAVSLLKPTVSLFYDLLNETGNPMPNESHYWVSFCL